MTYNAIEVRLIYQIDQLGANVFHSRSKGHHIRNNLVFILLQARHLNLHE